ncbi:hypothetical protein SNEBB_000896 [Seison nebaliae]|nr:hypothetical protein SNEBB_000896 [Seison nebaliae]
MNKIFLIISLLFITISSVYSIKCYLCAPGSVDCDLEGEHFRRSLTNYASECKGSCGKRWIYNLKTNKKRIMRSCDAPTCPNITNSRLNIGLFVLETHCCRDKDFCNRSSITKKSILLNISAFLLAIIFHISTTL